LNVKLVDLGSVVQVVDEDEGNGTSTSNPSPLSHGRSSATYRGHSLVGTLGCIAPESLQYFDYSCASDMWQLGCILYSMLSATAPFNQVNSNSAYSHAVYVRAMSMTGVAWEGISAILSIACPLRKYWSTFGLSAKRPRRWI
jgi:serine/threonine protein kinase